MAFSEPPDMFRSQYRIGERSITDEPVGTVGLRVALHREIRVVGVLGAHAGDEAATRAVGVEVVAGVGSADFR